MIEVSGEHDEMWSTCRILGDGMKYSGINSNDVKSENRSKIIRLLNDKGDMARKDIAVQLGLTAAAVTQISNELLELGILKENGEMEEEAHVGRKKIRIGIDADYTKILGICIERNDTVISVNNMMGKCLLKKNIRTDVSVLPEMYFERIIDTAYELMDNLSLKTRDFLGIGVSIPGYSSHDSGDSAAVQSIWDMPVPVKTILEKAFRLPIIIENNVNAFAIAELIYGAGREKGNFVFVKWGPGLGTAIAINNKVYSNQDGKTSELGHIIIDPSETPFESFVSSRAITDNVKEIFSETETPELWKAYGGDISRIDLKNISEWGQIKDPGLEKVLEDVMIRMIIALHNTSVILPPDKIICYGSTFDLPYVRDNFNKRFLEKFSMFDEDFLIRSTLCDHEDSVGAVAIVFNEMILKAKS